MSRPPFGAQLKALRQAAGFTQEELATIAGLSVHAVSALERGERARFGAGRSGHTHQGQDVMADCGLPLVAARGGRVQYTGTDGATGTSGTEKPAAAPATTEDTKKPAKTFTVKSLKMVAPSC